MAKRLGPFVALLFFLAVMTAWIGKDKVGHPPTNVDPYTWGDIYMIAFLFCIICTLGFLSALWFVSD